MAIDDKTLADDSRMPADEKQKASLDEAVKIVNQAIRERENELRKYMETDSTETVMVEGETDTGYGCCALICAKEVARIMLDYGEPMYRVLGEEYPQGIWDGLAHIAGLETIYSVDI